MSDAAVPPGASFRIVGSQVVAEAGFLAITEEAVDAPDGHRFTRMVVRHPGAVVVVPIAADGQHALLVRQWRAAVGGELLEVPAGKRDVDGEPPEETAVRELEEEIGHRPGRLVKLAEFFNTPGFCDEYTHLFAAFELEDLGATRAVGPEESAMTVERVPLRDVDALIAAREIVDAKSIIGLLLARRLLEHDPGRPGGPGAGSDGT